MSLKENILWTKEPSWNYYVGSHSFNTDRLLVHRSCLYFMWPFISTSTYSFLTLVKTIASSFMGLEEEMVKLISILVFHFFSGVFWPRPDLFGHGTTCSWLKCGKQEWNGQVQSCHVGCWRGEHVWYHFCYRGGGGVWFNKWSFLWGTFSRLDPRLPWMEASSLSVLRWHHYNNLNPTKSTGGEFLLLFVSTQIAS